MDRVYSQSQRQLSEVEFAAIAIKQVDHAQHHVGLLYRSGTSDAVKLLQLAWHFELRNSSPGRDYFWIAPRIPRWRLQLLASRCRQVFRRNRNSIPFGFSPPNYCIDRRTGEFLFGPTRHGLTCATLVLAVFESIGVSLLNYESWPIRTVEDRNWQDWVISKLEQSNPAPSIAHIEAIRKEVGGVRIRPEDVAGAVTMSTHPADSASIIARAAEILARLHSETPT